MDNPSGQLIAITPHLPLRQNKWSNRYIEKRNTLLESKEEERKVETESRKNYTPKFVDSKSVTTFVDKEREIQPIPYIDETHGPRNALCSFCNKTTVGVDDEGMGCDLCPAVAHNNCIYLSNRKCCLVEEDRNFTQRYKDHVADVVKNRGTIWCCKLCTSELNGSIDGEKSRLKFDRSKRLAYFSSMRLQAACLGHRARKRFIKVTAAAIIIQSWLRGQQMRRAFFTTLANAQRVFRIKNIEFELAQGIPITDNKSNLSCIAYVINNESNDLDDSERQMYRFDTHGIPQQNACGRFNDNFVVYSCNAMVQFVMTLHARNNENSTQRTIYLGQYTVDARRFLMKSFFTGRSVRTKGDLQSMEYEPKDQRFTFLKQSSALPEKERRNMKYGKISFDVQPVSYTVSKCGIIEEVLSSVIKGAKKKWYAVLADQVLYLFSHYGDSKPKTTIHLSQAHGSHVEWHNDEKNAIKLSNFSNQSYLFTCGSRQQLVSWYNKVR